MTKPKLPSSSPLGAEHGGRRGPNTWPSPSPFTFTWDAWVTKWTGTQSSTSWAREFPKGATNSGKPWPLSRLFTFSATSRHVVALVSLRGRKRRSGARGCCSHRRWSQASTARVLPPAALLSHSPEGDCLKEANGSLTLRILVGQADESKRMFPNLCSIRRLCTRRVPWPNTWGTLHTHVPPEAYWQSKGSKSYSKGSEKSCSKESCF